MLLSVFIKTNTCTNKPKHGIAMGSPISGIVAEIYLQHLEEMYMKHWIESGHIMYYKRYVDHIVIVFDHKKNEWIRNNQKHEQN